jgi:hypothetical protein
MDVRNLPPGPFRSNALDTVGLSRQQLRRLVCEGAVRRVIRGVYVDADLEDTQELRIAAVALVIPPSHVIRDRTAAWLHGVDVFTYAEHDVLPPVEACALRGKAPSGRAGVDGRTRDLAQADIMTLDGLLVTTPLRTALDLGCILRRREATAALDAFCRLHGLTKAQLVVGAKRYRRRRAAGAEASALDRHRRAPDVPHRPCLSEAADRHRVQRLGGPRAHAGAEGARRGAPGVVGSQRVDRHRHQGRGLHGRRAAALARRDPRGVATGVLQPAAAGARVQVRTLKGDEEPQPPNGPTTRPDSGNHSPRFNGKSSQRAMPRRAYASTMGGALGSPRGDRRVGNR